MPPKLGAVLPSREISFDRIAIRDYAQAAEDLGYTSIIAYDHPVGAKKPEGKGRANYQTPYIEPFVVLGALALATKKLKLTTGVLVLPQRQTVLVAKQAAAVDILSGGRLRLGVGVGLNPTDYKVLRENYRNRGKRIEKQIALLRALWTKRLVPIKTKWGRTVEAGINTLPIQRPIPIWMGGLSDVAIERTLRIADGWIPMGIASDNYVQKQVNKFGEALRRSKKKEFGMVGAIGLSGGGPDYWAYELKNWQVFGATEVVFITVDGGCGSNVGKHIKALEKFKEVASSV